MSSESTTTGPVPVRTAQLVQLLINRQLSLATAESLTGGALAAEFASVPGVSRVFQGGVVAYQNAIKAAVLGVSPELLATVGSVDGEVARQMALGSCRVMTSRVGMATTGAAGPEPHDGKPVGTVFVAVALDGEASFKELHFTGDRAEIRAQALVAALDLLAEVLQASQQTLGRAPGTKQFD